MIADERTGHIGQADSAGPIDDIIEETDEGDDTSFIGFGHPDEDETETLFLEAVNSPKVFNLEELAKQYKERVWNPESFLTESLFAYSINKDKRKDVVAFSKRHFNGRLPNKVKEKELSNLLPTLLGRFWSDINIYEAIFRLGAITNVKGTYKTHDRDELQGILGLLHLRFRKRTYVPENKPTVPLIVYVRHKYFLRDEDFRESYRGVWKHIAATLGKKASEINEEELYNLILSSHLTQWEETYEELYRLGAIKKTPQKKYVSLDDKPLEGINGLLYLRFKDKEYQPDNKLTIPFLMYVLNKDSGDKAGGFIKSSNIKKSATELTEEELYGLLKEIHNWAHNKWDSEDVFAALERLGPAPLTVAEPETLQESGLTYDIKINYCKLGYKRKYSVEKAAILAGGIPKDWAEDHGKKYIDNPQLMTDENSFRNIYLPMFEILRAHLIGHRNIMKEWTPFLSGAEVLKFLFESGAYEPLRGLGVDEKIFKHVGIQNFSDGSSESRLHLTTMENASILEIDKDAYLMNFKGRIILDDMVLLELTEHGKLKYPMGSYVLSQYENLRRT